MHHEIAQDFLTMFDSVVAAPRGHGKKIANSIPILTLKGWSTHGDLQYGDYVFSPSGKPIKIINTSTQSKCDYVVHTRDGEIIRAHAEHEWTVWDRNLKREVTIETKDMVGSEGRRSRYLLPLREALQFPTKKLPLDPYYVGLWLGDGCSTDTGISHCPDDIDSIKSIPYKISTQQTHKITGVIKTNFTRQGIQEKLKVLKIFNNKHIPIVYQLSSKQQRLELLAGLIDSDGSVDKNRGRVRFVNINKVLIDDVCEIVNSLGMRPIITQQKHHSNGKGIIGKSVCYTVQFNPIENIPTRLERKKIVRLPNRPRLGITLVEYVPNGEMGKCIQVDSVDGLYLVGKNLIPTHNSTEVGLGVVIWNILYRKAFYILYISQNHSKTVQFLEPIRFELNTNKRLHFIYGKFDAKNAFDEDGKNREDVFDVGNIRVQGLSFEKNPRGLKHGNQRPDLVIGDDIEDDQRVLNPELRAKDYDRWLKQIIPGMDIETGRSKLVGTILNINSLLMNEIRLHNGKIWKACELDKDGKVDPKTILFPDMFTAEKLEALRRKMGTSAFQSEYLNNPVDNASSVIKREWIEAGYDDTFSMFEAGDTTYDNTYMGVDFAFSDRITADKSAFAGIGQIEKDYDIIMLREEQGWSPKQQFDLIEYLTGFYHFTDNALEENSIRSLSKNLLTEYTFPYTLFWMGASDPAHQNRPAVDYDQKRYTIGKINTIDRLAAHFEENIAALEEGKRPHIRLPYKTEADKRWTHNLTDQVISWAKQDGKIVEVGVHPDLPIALCLALERAEMDRYEASGGVLEL